MAKPLLVAPLHGVDPTPPRCYSQLLPETSYRPRRRRSHRPSKPSSSTVGPSSGLLSLLATIASATSANASPAPPQFLCPSIGTRDIVDERPLAKKRASSSSSPSTVNDTNKWRSKRQLPHKYERGSDGVWRRVDSYTLYGSTVPSGCTSPNCLQPTHGATSTPIDDQIRPPSDTSLPTNPSSSAYDIRTELPPGWMPKEKPYGSRTPLIVSLSVVLALLICFFIVGCLFRRKTYKKYVYYDVEARAKRRRRRHEPTEEELLEIEVEKEIKVKQKIWARATARWRANARYSARQRRGKRLSTRYSQAQHQSSLSLDAPRGRTAGSISQFSSRQSSRRSSLGSLHDQPRHEEPEPSSSQEQSNMSQPTQIVAPTSPPAYQHRGPPFIFTPDDSSSHGSSGHTTPSHPGRSRRPSHCSVSAPSIIPPHPHDTELLPPVQINAAHVATDDKALLARLAELASAPPAEDGTETAGPSEPEVSAPVWQDEEIDDFSHAPQTSMDSKPDTASSSLPVHLSLPSLFPPPPSKERLAAAERLEYSFRFDDLETAEPDCEPSAPPFEEGSTPPMDGDCEVPMASAPPLLDDEHDQHGIDSGLELHAYTQLSASAPPLPDSADSLIGASAPECDGSPQSQGPHEDGVTTANHPSGGAESTSSDAVTVGLTVPGSGDSVHTLAPSNSNSASTLSARIAGTASTARDDDRPLSTASVNTLPGYQP